MEDDKSARIEHDAALNTVAASQWPEGTLFLAPCSPHRLAQLIGSYGKPAEMPFPRTCPLPSSPDRPLASVLSCQVSWTHFQSPSPAQSLS